MAKDTPDSIKILMLAEAGFQPIPLARKYLKLIRFVKEIALFPENEMYHKAKELLIELQEIE